MRDVFLLVVTLVVVGVLLTDDSRNYHLLVAKVTELLQPAQECGE